MCVVPDKAIEPTPLMALSIISILVFVVVPQVPACSPEPIFSTPEFIVYVLAMCLSYMVFVVTSTQLSSPDGEIVDHVSLSAGETSVQSSSPSGATITNNKDPADS